MIRRDADRKTVEKSRRLRNSRGQSLVEFALAMPLVLLILMGTMEWGFLLWTQTMLVNASRDGARAAVVYNDWATNQSGNTESVKDVVVDRVSSLPESLKQELRDHINVELLPGASDIQSIRVSIEDFPYVNVLGLDFIPTPPTLSSSVEFRVE